MRIALPLAKPVVALVFFFSFVADWNNFFLPYVFLADSNQYPITVGLSNLLASTPSFNPSVGGGGQSVNIFKPELALRDPAGRRAGGDRLRVLAASARPRPRRRSREGMSDGKG